MARGRRPKPPHLRLIDGTHRPTRHGSAPQARAAVEATASRFGPLTTPKDLKGEARSAWIRYIAPANWLDASRAPAAIAFCLLWQEMLLAPTRFQAAKHAQLRGYSADLGLTDQRRRNVEREQPRDEFFDE
jgi:hypothetical protein